MNSLTTAYESLLVHNLSAVRTIESGIRNITWLLPGRFEDADIASEGLYALLSVVSSYHDTLLSHRLSPNLSLPGHPFSSHPSNSSNGDSNDPKSLAPIIPPSSHHTRYTKYWTSRSGLYRKASRLLNTLSFVELLIEMLARKKGDGARWRLVLWVEGIKTFLRLLILRITNRPVLTPPVPQREIDLTLLPSTLLDPPLPPLQDDPSNLGDLNTPNIRSKPLIPSMPPHAPLRTHLYPLANSLPEHLLPHPLTLLPPIRSMGGYVSEILTSSATLVQVILLLRAARPPRDKRYKPLSLPTLSRNITPWLLPMLLRLLARHLREIPKDSVLLAEHQAQLDKRLLKHFFLTGPIWVGWTRPKIMGIVGLLRKIPLVGLAGELVEGYLPLVDDHFYYTSS